MNSIVKNGRPTLEEVANQVDSATDIVNAIDPEGINPTNDPYIGLTDQQKLIARLKLRGLTQAQIGQFLNISQPAVSKHIANINAHLNKRGSSLNQARMVGETGSLYEEIEARSWEVYMSSTEPKDKLKAMQTIMAARERHTKLLMELGHLKRAAVQQNIVVSPLIKAWQSGEAQGAVNAIINSQLSELEEPVPPEDDYIEADFTEIEGELGGDST